MPRYHIAGGAKVTSLTGGTLGPTGLSFTIDDPTGWPTGGANGEFWVVINPEQANEEHLLASNRSGSTITIASTGKRGLDGTSAGTHNIDSTVLHGFVGVQADDANAHQFDTTRDDHTQYHNASRHAAVSHTSAMIGADQITSTHIATNAVGALELADNAVDTNAIVALAVTSGKIGANQVIAGKLADGSVDTSGRFAAGVVNSAALAASAVVAGKIAAGGVSATNQIADAIVTLAKLASEGSTAFVPDFSMVTLGTGGLKYGQYFKLGRLVVGIAGFRLGTGGNVTGQITYTLPHTVADFDAGGASTGWITAARAFDQSANAVYSGLGIVTTTAADAWVMTGVGAAWDANAPFDWAANDVFASLFVYEATA